MRFMGRVVRLVKADAHGVVDALEDRALLLRQQLREAELALEDKRARLRSLERQQTGLAKEVERMRTAIQGIDADVELALERGQEDLARYAVKRLLPLRERCQELERRLAWLREQDQQLRAELADQEPALESLRARVRTALERLEHDTGSEPASEPHAVSDEDVELELLRRREQRVGGA